MSKVDCTFFPDFLGFFFLANFIGQLLIRYKGRFFYFTGAIKKQLFYSLNLVYPKKGTKLSFLGKKNIVPLDHAIHSETEVLCIMDGNPL